MKKKQIILIFLSVFLLNFTLTAGVILAADCDISNISECELPNAIKTIYEWGVRFGAVLAFIMIMVGGVLWMMSGGSPERVSNAKSYISSSLIGLILLLTSYMLLQTINPRLLSLELPYLPALIDDPIPEGATATGSFSEDCDQDFTVNNYDNVSDAEDKCRDYCDWQVEKTEVGWVDIIERRARVCCSCKCSPDNDCKFCEPPTPEGSCVAIGSECLSTSGGNCH